MTIHEAYAIGYNSGWKMKYTPVPKEIEKDPNLYKHFCEGEKNGYSDWMYECNSDCD